MAGVVHDGLAVYKGIPFAAPPTGKLRWREPQPVIPWDGVKVADTFGDSPMQDGIWRFLMSSPADISEDCLYLNVWTPAKTNADRLPVMVWIYGGGFFSGMSSAKLYDGAQLAKRGVVLVSIGYRVGPFGFLAHPELSQESGHGSGNYGLLDQVAALRWVRENIAQFGGDPDRVTIFGESAGGISVAMLTVVPAAKGLFQRAIAESGGCMAPLQTGQAMDHAVPVLSLAEANGKAFLEQLVATNLSAARALSASKIQHAGIKMGQFWPVADGWVLPGEAYRLYERSEFHDTPLLMGSNSDEGAMFVHSHPSAKAFATQVRTHYGGYAEEVLAAYPHGNSTETFQSTKDIFRDTAFGWPTWATATLRERAKAHPTYVYYFDHSAPKEGSTHASEIAYVFGNLGGWGGGNKPADKALAELMGQYWVNFAATGDPNGPGLPTWPAFATREQSAMIFDGHPSARSLPNLDKIMALDHYFAGEREKETFASSVNK